MPADFTGFLKKDAVERLMVPGSASLSVWPRCQARISATGFTETMRATRSITLLFCALF